MNLAGKGGRASVSLGRSTPLLAVLLLLLAGWFGWSAYDQWRDAGTATELEQRRDQVVAGLQKTLLAQTTELAQRLQLEPVKAALAEGNADAAAAAIADGWPGVETVQVLDAALDEAYRDPAAFGYSRLALLETAAQDSAPVAHVIRDDGSTRFGLAAAVQLGPRPALVYVRQPLSRLTAVFDQIRTPDGAYLALRQSNHTVIERGASSLGKGAEALARPVAKSSLRVSAAVPDIEPGPLGLGTIGCAVVAVLLLLIALLAVLGKGRVRMPKRLQRGEAVDTGPTLRESLQQEPPPSTAVADDAAAATEPAAVPAGRQVPAAIFRAYDIRGVVERDLDAEVAELIGQAIGSAMQEQGLRDVVVGRDGRLSGPQLSAGLIEGLRRAGCEVIDIGLAPTPVVYYASYHLRAGSCVAVTGSHNPADHNGFKIVIGGQTLSGEAITDLHARISDGRLHTAAEPGGLQSREVIADYIQRIADDVQLDRPLKVVADAGNGVAGAVVQPLLEAIGAEVIALHCDVDGTFPNHHPDPSEPHNLEDLIQTVKRFDADLGIAFDGDGDRLGVVTGQGQIIYPDRLLMLFAGDVLQRNPGALVIYDVKCTGKLSDYVLRHGGSPMMWKTGHSLIKAKMRETDAELAGEMSGHFFFKERWYGFDDGLYAAARLLEILGQRDESPSEVLAELPESVATPEIKVAVAEGSAHAEVARFVSAAQDDDSGFFGARLSMIDGLRADFADGWGLVRASNTTSVLVLRFEADDAAALERIKALFRTQLQALLPELQPGF